MAAAPSTDDTTWTVTGMTPVVIAAALFLGFLTYLPVVAAGEPVRLAWQWAPQLDLTLSFFIDGLSLTFALLISGIGALVMLYSAKYLAGHPHQARFSIYITSFMLAMLGLVLSDNLICLFVFWELTSVTSFLLIGFSNASPESRRSALQALVVTVGGGLAMLAGFIIIGSVAGTFELSEIRAAGDVLRDSTYFLPILILVLCGAFTKSAQFPFHFWLPNAMAAPTPVSAYLHSATMVKGGVYLLARVHPSLSGGDVWLWTLTIFGGFTAVFASIVSVRQTDLKQTLAYTTLMALGTLVLFLAAPGGYAITAAATFLIVHSLYKASLFLVVGCVDYRCGTRSADILGGIGPRMPITAFSAALAGLAMAGMIPFLGFIAKEFLYKGGLETPASVIFVVGATFAASALMFAVGGIVGFRPFWGNADEMTERHEPEAEAPFAMLLGPGLLAVLGLVFGIFPEWIQHQAVTPIVAAITGDASNAKTLELWQGVNTAFILSMATYAVGLLLYMLHRPLRVALTRAAEALPSFDRGWDGLLAGIDAISAWQTDILQSGVLKRYMTVTLVVLLVAMVVTTARFGLDQIQITLPELPQLDITIASIFLLTVCGTLVSVYTGSRIAAIAGLGVVGIAVALIFIIHGAPDLAITQLMVETLIVVLYAVAVLRLPYLPPRSERKFRWGDAILSVGIGGMVTVILLQVVSGPLDRRLTDYFEANSYVAAYGQNIVNVILVDFRALDTMGEIAVVAIAALAAFALLRQKGGETKS